MWCKAEFSAPLLQSSVSHDLSEIILICWFAVQETFSIIINVENRCAASYFYVNHDFVSGFLMTRKLLFFNNASLLSNFLMMRCIFLNTMYLFKNLTDPWHMNGTAYVMMILKCWRSYDLHEPMNTVLSSKIVTCIMVKSTGVVIID